VELTHKRQLVVRQKKSYWNEDPLFVTAEPLDPSLTIAVKDVFSGQLVGQARVPLSSVHRRSDDRAKPPPCWLNLYAVTSPGHMPGECTRARVFLEGGPGTMCWTRRRTWRATTGMAHKADGQALRRRPNVAAVGVAPSPSSEPARPSA
jgi:hypothetical protein